MNERRRAELGGGRSVLSAAEGGTITRRRRLKRALAVAAAAVVGAIALAGCGGNHKTETFRVNITSANGVSGFSIGTITVTQGDKIDLRVDNTTDKAHGFSIDAFNVHRVVEPNTAQTVSFTPKKTGEFKVYCQLHPAHVPANIIVLG